MITIEIKLNFLIASHSGKVDIADEIVLNTYAKFVNRNQYFILLKHLDKLKSKLREYKIIGDSEKINSIIRDISSTVTIKPSSKYPFHLYVNKDIYTNGEDKFLSNRNVLYIDKLDEFLKLLEQNKNIKKINLTGIDDLKREYENMFSLDLSNINLYDKSKQKQCEFKNFQQEAISFALHNNKSLCALGTGLGKTVVAIAMYDYIKRLNSNAKALVLCMASLRRQWQEQIENFTNYSTQIVHASEYESDELSTSEKRLLLYDNNQDITIVSFATARTDYLILQNYDYDIIIVDESSLLRNVSAKQTKAIFGSSQNEPLESPYKICLTATPIENKAEDIYPTFEWMYPGIFGSYSSFQESYLRFVKKGMSRRLKNYKNLDDLRHKIAPYTFRRTRYDVKDEYKNKIISSKIPVQLDTNSQSLYRAIKDGLLNDINLAMELEENINTRLENGEIISEKELKESKEIQYNNFAKLGLIRQFILHPKLIQLYNSKYAPKVIENPLYKKCGHDKFDCLINQLKIYTQSEKVVVFTFYKQMIFLISQELKKLDIEHRIYTGDQNPKAKDAARIAFKTNPNIKVLLCSDSGAFGLDLPEASVVIHYDLLFNPAKLNQRSGRIDRVISEHDLLYIEYIITERTIEQKIADIVVEKQSLSDSLIENDATGEIKLTNKLLKSLLEE